MKVIVQAISSLISFLEKNNWVAALVLGAVIFAGIIRSDNRSDKEKAEDRASEEIKTVRLEKNQEIAELKKEINSLRYQLDSVKVQQVIADRERFKKLEERLANSEQMKVSEKKKNNQLNNILQENTEIVKKIDSATLNQKKK